MIDGKLINYDYPSISADEWHKNFEAGIRRMAEETERRNRRLACEKRAARRRKAVQRKLCRRGKR